MAHWKVCYFVRSWGEWNNFVFGGLERGSSDVWFLVRFHVSL